MNRFLWLRHPKQHRRRRERPERLEGPRPRRVKREEETFQISESWEDRVVRRLAQLWDLALDRPRETLVAVGSLVLIVAAIIWYVVREKHQEREAWLRLSKAMVTAEQALRQPKEKRTTTKIDEVARQFKRIQRDLGTTRATPYVLLELGNYLYGEGKYKEAYDAYMKLIGKYPRHYAAKLGRLAAAYCLEEEGECKGAIELLTALRKRCPEFLISQVELDLGRCYERLNEKDKARQHYQAVVEREPTSEIGAVAKYRLDRMARKQRSSEEKKKAKSTQKQTTR